MIKVPLTNGQLILVDDLNPQEVAMLQALYSRSAESAEVHLNKIYAARRAAMREVLPDYDCAAGGAVYDALYDAAHGSSDKADNFMSKFYVGYGHQSIADCGTTTLFIEGVSILAAKAIQDWPLYNGQETSTRYIDMAKQRIVDPFSTPASAEILERWMAFYTGSQQRVMDEIVSRYPKGADEKDDVYYRAVKARTFDILRGFLPAGITTQLSWHTNLRQAGDHLVGLTKHPAEEIANLGSWIQGTLRERYNSSSFGSGPSVSGIGTSGERATEREQRQHWEERVARCYTYNGVEGSHTHPLTSTIRTADLLQYKDILETRPRGAVLPHIMTDLGQITYRFMLDFGSFRDIQRHRNGVCRMPLLTAPSSHYSFEPWYLEQLGGALEQEARELVRVQHAAIHRLPDDPVARQYYHALGFRVPCSVTYGLPAAVYVMELRSGKMIHPTLRRAIHKMIYHFKMEHPSVPIHVDMDQDDWDVRRGTQTILAK